MVRVHKVLDPSRTGREAEHLETSLLRKIVGQDEAVGQIVNIYQTFHAGLNPTGRPIANLLFLGPTGTGKTRVVEATAEALVGDARAVTKIDCAEFQHSHEIAKLIGSPPGYLGHRETHPLLSQEVLNQYHTDKIRLSFVLFDEIEKASDALWNLLLGILDKATLTLGDNRRVDFSRAMIFMTSNLGATEMSSILRPNLGFAAADSARQQAEGRLDAAVEGKISRAGLEAARKKFTPEFMNRIDKSVVFRPLGSPELRQILDIELGMLQQRVVQSTTTAPFVFSLSDPAKDHLLREGTDPKYGARHLKRAIERTLVHPLSNLIATEQVRAGDMIRVDYDSVAGITFCKEAEDLPAYTMAQMMGASQDAPPQAAAAEVEVPKFAGVRSGRRG